MKRFPSLIRVILVVCVALPSLAGCAGYPRGWRQEARKPPAHPVAGAWEGSWRSDVNGHRGALRCLVRGLPDGRFEFRYRATWAKFLCAGYTVACYVRPGENETWIVSGERDLGRLFGGVFSHEGVIDGDTFTAGYKSALDRGVMEMRRVRPPKHETP